jgi:hypothetical protein
LHAFNKTRDKHAIMNTLELKIPPAALSFIYVAAMSLSLTCAPSLTLTLTIPLINGATR